MSRPWVQKSLFAPKGQKRRAVTAIKQRHLGSINLAERRLLARARMLCESSRLACGAHKLNFPAWDEAAPHVRAAFMQQAARQLSAP